MTPQVFNLLWRLRCKEQTHALGTEFLEAGRGYVGEHLGMLEDKENLLENSKWILDQFIFNFNIKQNMFAILSFSIRYSLKRKSEISCR